MHKPFQAADGRMKYVKIKQRQKGNHHFIVVPEVFNQVTKVAHSSKQSVQ